MSLSDVVVYGTGSRGVLVNKLNMRQRKPVWSASANAEMQDRVLYKISTDAPSHNVEIQNAMLLSQLDKNQRYFVYPISTYTLTGDPKLLRHVDAFNRVPGKKFNVNANTMFVDIIPYGGKSLKKLKDTGFTFTPRQAKLAINFLLQGLVKLHQAGISHGDVHAHNTLIHVYKNGNVIARWIDFGEMEHSIEHQRDVKQFNHIIQMIISMVREEDDALNTIYSKTSRGVAHMNASGLMFDISGLLKSQPSNVATQDKRRRSPSSASPRSPSQGDNVKKALRF